jgi:hypothetical protein
MTQMNLHGMILRACQIEVCEKFRQDSSSIVGVHPLYSLDETAVKYWQCEIKSTKPTMKARLCNINHSLPVTTELITRTDKRQENHGNIESQ